MDFAIDKAAFSLGKVSMDNKLSLSLEDLIKERRKESRKSIKATEKKPKSLSGLLKDGSSKRKELISKRRGIIKSPKPSSIKATIDVQFADKPKSSFKKSAARTAISKKLKKAKAKKKKALQMSITPKRKQTQKSGSTQRKKKKQQSRSGSNGMSKMDVSTPSGKKETAMKPLLKKLKANKKKKSTIGKAKRTKVLSKRKKKAQK